MTPTAAVNSVIYNSSYLRYDSLGVWGWPFSYCGAYVFTMRCRAALRVYAASPVGPQKSWGEDRQLYRNDYPNAHRGLLNLAESREIVYNFEERQSRDVRQQQQKPDFKCSVCSDGWRIWLQTRDFRNSTHNCTGEKTGV